MSDPGRIVDAHVHGYTAEVAADPAAWGAARGEEAWVRCVAPEGKRSIQGWADCDTLVRDMDRAGVAACVLLGWYWERQETCDLQNAWHLEWIRRHPHRLVGFATVQPRAGERALAALEKALDAGLAGIGEILPQAQGFSLSDPVWRTILGIASERDLPVTLHATDPEAGPAAGPRTPLEDYVQMAGEFPGVNFILAHWGGGLAFRELAEFGALPPNLYFDTAASPLLYDIGVFKSALAKVGPSRILYGSDYPLILYPRTARIASFEPFLDEIAAAGLRAPERDAIMASNILRLLPAGVAQALKGV